MAKQTKAAEAAPKYKKDGIGNVLLPLLDKLVKWAAGLFFVATSYGYVSGWLKTHQNQPEVAVAGSIIVVAVALYLYSRK